MFITKKAKSGLAGRAARKMMSGEVRGDMGAVPMPQIIAAAMAHAAYPNSEASDPSLNEIFPYLPEPIIDWDSAGRTAHQCLDFGDFSADECMRMIYGKNCLELIELVLTGIEEEPGKRLPAAQTATGCAVIISMGLIAAAFLVMVGTSRGNVP